MSRQFLDCPGAEAHTARLERIKTLGTVGAARHYLAEIRVEQGDFWADYLEADFNAWLSTKKEAAVCQPS